MSGHGQTNMIVRALPDHLVGGLIFWHYTTGKNFEAITRDGLIVPATAGVPKREKPIVWFSSNQYWEQTAGKMLKLQDGTLVKLTMEETCKFGRGLVRIGAAPETAPHDWVALKRLGRMSKRTARGLWAAGIKDGADPAEWFGTFDSVPREKWKAVHLFQGGTWNPVKLPDW
jgi:hypothetical protein